MSEAADEETKEAADEDGGAASTRGREVWIEKYRPQSLADVKGHEQITERLASYIERNDLPHLLFAGPAGTGKTTSAVAIAKELYGDEWRENFLELNASDQRGIDVVRDRIKNFARSSFGGFDYRVIFLDEADALCVPPGTEVVTGYPSSPEVKPIEQVAEDGEPIPSVDFETNEVQPDEGKLVDSGVADFFDLELGDGRTILASLTHPFFVVGEDGKLVEKELRELNPGDEIADFKNDIGVSRCEICDEWTTGRFCSLDCKTMRDPEVAQKVSEALNGHEPTGGENVRHSDELGHLVRSDWEYEVATSLQDAGIECEYEPEFELSDSVFHADFLVDDRVIEVNGVAGLWGQTEKMEEFLERYGDDYRFVVVGDGELPHHEHYERDEFEPAAISDGGVRTVETAEVQSIEYSHRGRAYNVSMETTPNFMLANGILTHNTSDAQSALRRTMEQFSNNTRFVLSCNYSSQIIDPIQSRCAVFRFSPLADEAVAAQVREIAAAEGIEVTDDGVEALVYAADGDMRKAINGLQAAAVMGETVDEETVFAITSTARPEEIREMVDLALEGDFAQARSRLDHLLTEVGIAGGDIVDQLHRSVWEFDIPDREAVRLMDRVGEADYRITAGANEQVQLEALLASLALDDE
jgi:DNA polymerase III delta prime subunit